MVKRMPPETKLWFSYRSWVVTFAALLSVAVFVGRREHLFCSAVAFCEARALEAQPTTLPTENGETWIRGNPNGPNAVRASNGQFWELELKTAIDPKWFGAKGDAATDDAGAINTAFSWAKRRSLPVHFTRGYYNLAESVAADRVEFHGDGPDEVHFTSTSYNGPYFVITSNGASLTGNVYGGFSCQWGGNPTYEHTACVEIVGDDRGYFQYNQFRHIRSNGLYTAFAISKKGSPIAASGSTPARSGGNVDWLSFQDIECNTFAQPGKFCIWYQAGSGGSGTGTTYTHLGGNIGGYDAMSAFFRFEGDIGATVGDIIIADSEFNNPRTIVSIGAGASYLNNIAFVGTQFDSAVKYPIHFDTPLFNDATLGRPQGLRFQGSLFGGGQDVYAGVGPAVTQSLIPDVGASSWQAGSVKSVERGIAQVPIFQIDLSSSYGGTSMDVRLSGLVNGRGSAASSYTCSFAAYGRSSRAACSLVASVNSDGSRSPAMTLDTVAKGNSIVLSANIPTRSGASVEAQIQVVGGTFKLKRL